MQRAPQLQRTERKTRHALEVLAEVPYNEMELGKVYRLERTGELVKWTMAICKGKQIRRLKRLCNTCEKNGRVPREANYKDGDGKFTKCSHSLFHNVSRFGLISPTEMSKISTVSNDGSQ